MGFKNAFNDMWACRKFISGLSWVIASLTIPTIVLWNSYWTQIKKIHSLAPAIIHMLYRRFLTCVLLNFVSNAGQKDVVIYTHTSYS